ncbi:arylsulfatase [Planctomyces sp. SH-PL62]|uniref:arylsulfatase n=1 Tax=Planctomyces sp. SH-PL62 TaxID=1636152 RepID=UPI00078B78BB|nr:arylsulfatase [Planctomyces sp. SH-PL62]AMV39561.1 Arylsulfatase precursor [Planctomyces sp. SH-PL62]
MRGRSTFAFLMGLGLTLPTASAGVDPARPNVVVVMPDDIGHGDFSINGSPIVRTPNVDAFARESLRFTGFHVSPTCAPTRAALLTGRHEFKSGVTHTINERERLDLRATTFAQVLKANGYATGIFGKWHLGDEAEYQPERRGFDETFVHGGGGIGQSYPGSCGDAPGNTYFDPAIRRNGVFEKTKGYCTDVFFDRALAWMDARRRAAAPFFAFITPNAAHVPLQCPEDYAKRHADEVSEDVARFYGMIENIDDNFGKLTSALRDWGIERDTLVIFLTDNGGTLGVPIFNSGMRGRKVEPYEGGTRVPSFWRWPAGVQGGRDVSGLTAHVDVFPTLVEILGVEPGEEVRGQVEGRSLVPFFRDRPVDWPRRTLVTHVGRWGRGEVAAFKFRGVSIRDDRFALVNDAELYDLQSDPGQKSNVIADHPEVVERLRAEYETWWASIHPGLVNEDAVGPKMNPYHEWYWEQFGGGPKS